MVGNLKTNCGATDQASAALVMELKERKAELFAQVVDGDGLLGEAITADDVRGLVL